jgi:hypothetical protein
MEMIVVTVVNPIKDLLEIQMQAGADSKKRIPLPMFDQPLIDGVLNGACSAAKGPSPNVNRAAERVPTQIIRPAYTATIVGPHPQEPFQRQTGRTKDQCLRVAHKTRQGLLKPLLDVVDSYGIAFEVINGDAVDLLKSDAVLNRGAYFGRFATIGNRR